jgi:hypothetical protein
LTATFTAARIALIAFSTAIIVSAVLAVRIGYFPPGFAAIARAVNVFSLGCHSS